MTTNCEFFIIHFIAVPKIYKKPFEFRDLYVRLQKEEEFYKEKIEKYNSIKNEIETEFKTAFLLSIHLLNLYIDKETEK